MNIIEEITDSKGWSQLGLCGRVGRRYYHPKTRRLYRVVGLAFQAEGERWMILYRRESEGEDGAVFAHLPEDFDREGRFLTVEE